MLSVRIFSNHWNHVHLLQCCLHNFDSSCLPAFLNSAFIAYYPATDRADLLFASSYRCSEHIDVFVDYEDVGIKVNEICNRTFLGDFVVGEVKIKENSSGNSYTEVWALKIPVNMKFSLKQYYKACAERCGFIY